MSLKWGEEKVREFSSPIMKAERGIDWAWWGLIITVFVTMIIVLKKIL